MARTRQQRFVAEMGGALRDGGLPPLPARVFSALLVDDDGQMTAAELADVLGVSAAGVSGAVKYLSTVQMIRRERLPGTRKEVFIVDEDAWHAAMVSTGEMYPPMLAALDRAITELSPGAPQRQRLILAREFLAFVDVEMTAIARRWDRRKRKLLRELG